MAGEGGIGRVAVGESGRDLGAELRDRTKSGRRKRDGSMGAGGPGNQTRCDGRVPLWNRTLAIQLVTSKVHIPSKRGRWSWGLVRTLATRPEKGKPILNHT